MTIKQVFYVILKNFFVVEFDIFIDCLLGDFACYRSDIN
jgi:hypothetical protein